MAIEAAPDILLEVEQEAFFERRAKLLWHWASRVGTASLDHSGDGAVSSGRDSAMLLVARSRFLSGRDLGSLGCTSRRSCQLLGSFETLKPLLNYLVDSWSRVGLLSSSTASLQERLETSWTEVRDRLRSLTRPQVRACKHELQARPKEAEFVLGAIVLLTEREKEPQWSSMQFILADGSALSRAISYDPNATPKWLVQSFLKYMKVRRVIFENLRSDPGIIGLLAEWVMVMFAHCKCNPVILRMHEERMELGNVALNLSKWALRPHLGPILGRPVPPENLPRPPPAPHPKYQRPIVPGRYAAPIPRRETGGYVPRPQGVVVPIPQSLALDPTEPSLWPPISTEVPLPSSRLLTSPLEPVAPASARRALGPTERGRGGGGGRRGEGWDHQSGQEGEGERQASHSSAQGSPTHSPPSQPPSPSHLENLDFLESGNYSWLLAEAEDVLQEDWDSIQAAPTTPATTIESPRENLENSENSESSLVAQSGTTHLVAGAGSLWKCRSRRKCARGLRPPPAQSPSSEASLDSLLRSSQSTAPSDRHAGDWGSLDAGGSAHSSQMTIAESPEEEFLELPDEASRGKIFDFSEEASKNRCERARMGAQGFPQAALERPFRPPATAPEAPQTVFGKEASGVFGECRSSDWRRRNAPPIERSAAAYLPTLTDGAAPLQARLEALEELESLDGPALEVVGPSLCFLLAERSEDPELRWRVAAALIKSTEADPLLAECLTSTFREISSDPGEDEALKALALAAVAQL